MAELRSGGAPVSYETITSDHGHDGFLIEFDQLNPILDGFLSDQAKR